MVINRLLQPLRTGRHRYGPHVVPHLRRDHQNPSLWRELRTLSDAEEQHVPLELF